MVWVRRGSGAESGATASGEYESQVCGSVNHHGCDTPLSRPYARFYAEVMTAHVDHAPDL